MTVETAGPVLTGALLLAGAGAAKAARPAGTARALRQAGWPVGAGTVRAGAAGEVVVGVAAAAVGGAVPIGLLALSYLGFALFVSAALWRRWPLATCGCFGEPDTPPTATHAALDAGLGLAAVAAFVSGGPAPLDLVARRPGWGAGLVLVAAVVAGLLYLVMARAPRLRVQTAR
jgi:hypothetical protein